jgi:hypothetical protein
MTAYDWLHNPDSKLTLLVTYQERDSSDKWRTVKCVATPTRQKERDDQGALSMEEFARQHRQARAARRAR